MCQPKKWWLGLLPLALLWVLANWFSTGRIEADIGQRTVEVLKGAALDKPNILVQGRDVTLSGQAFVDGESKKDAILAANQNGVRLAVDATSLVPEVKPYAWSVTRDGAKVTLAGNVPNPEVRAALNAAAKKAFAGAEIADTMTYGRGAPACLAAASGLGFNTLAGLAKGSVALAGEVVGVQGEAREFAGYDSALAALKTPLEGCTVKGAEAILPPEIKPYAWSATHSGNTLTITGYVPDAAARTAIGAAAKAALPGVSIVDTTRIARGAPATLVAGAAYGLGQLANLGDGSATLTDASLALSGEAASPAKFAALAEAAKSAPGGVTVSVPAVRAAEVKPFAWSAIRTAEGVTLTGYAPSAGAQVRILAAAKAALPGLAITDKTLVARGAPGGIETATSYALGELARLSAGSVGLVDSAYTIAGEAPTPEVFATAQKALATVPVGFALASDMIRAPEVARFDWSAVRTAEGVTLGGFAPSVGAKARIFSAAKAAFPGVPVADTMLVARGAPAGIEAATTYALGELAHLATGTVGLSGTSYSIAGEAPTPLSYGASIDALKALPPGFVLGTDMIRAPEVSGFNWQAVRDGETVTLEGYAPSLGAQARILAAAKAALPGVTVVDNTLVARGAPAGIEAAASYALGEVARLSNGVASVRDTAISVSGEGMSSAAYLASTAKLKTAPGGFVIAQADVLPPRVDIPTWSASRDGNTVTLAGFVASVEQQSAISEAAQAAMPGAVIVDQMQVARGINGDLEAVANYGLGQLANLSSGMVAVSGRDYSLSGEAATPAAFAATQDAQKNLTSSYGVVAQNVRPPAVSPFVWTATREGNAVTLTGLAASADARDRILAAAKAALPGLGIVDKTLVARGAPMGFEAMAGFGVKQLAHLSQGLVTASDQNFSIAGEAANAAAYEAATGGLKQLPSGFALVSEAIRLPLAKPYVFSMARADKQVILSGTLPSAAVQTAVRAAAKAAFPGATVTDTSTLARGASAGLDKAVTFGIGQLAQLAKGAFTLSDATYSISGDAASPAAFKAVNDELAKLPSPFAVGTANIVAPPPPPPPAPAPPPPPAPAPASPPAPAPAPGPVTTGPYGFEAVKEEGTLTLTGSYPDEKAHEDILDVVKHRFFNAKLDDKLAQQAGAPKNFVAAVTVALDQLARLATGKISLADTSLHVSGEALYDKAANEVQTTSAALLPPGFEVQTTVTARPVTTDLTAATCQEYLTGILGLGTIRFDSDSASIKAESFGLLDALAATAARCPSAKIEIAGHTDGVGNADYNKDLSVRRAQAVAVYLTKTGLALGTLTPVGYGLTHPIAPNDTEEGRAKNRRIDFVVK